MGFFDEFFGPAQNPWPPGLGDEARQNIDAQRLTQQLQAMRAAQSLEWQREMARAQQNMSEFTRLRNSRDWNPSDAFSRPPQFDWRRHLFSPEQQAVIKRYQEQGIQATPGEFREMLETLVTPLEKRKASEDVIEVEYEVVREKPLPLPPGGEEK